MATVQDSSVNEATLRHGQPLVLALGASCQCTYQVRRFTGVERASYFDWLGTTHEALAAILRRGFYGTFLRENLILDREGTTVKDLVTGVSYRHAFKWLPESKLIDPLALEQDYPKQREKYSALAERWLQDVRSCEILFVRQDIPSSHQVEELIELLEAHCKLRFQLLIITNCRSSAEQLKCNHAAFAVEYINRNHSSHSRWQGSDGAWNSVLRNYIQPATVYSDRPAVARELTVAEIKARNFFTKI